MGNGIPFLSYKGDPPKNDNTKVTLGLARDINSGTISLRLLLIVRPSPPQRAVKQSVFSIEVARVGFLSKAKFICAILKVQYQVLFEGHHHDFSLSGCDFLLTSGEASCLQGNFCNNN